MGWLAYLYIIQSEKSFETISIELDSGIDDDGRLQDKSALYPSMGILVNGLAGWNTRRKRTNMSNKNPIKEIDWNRF